MAVINCAPWEVSGDIGGIGLTRYWFENAGHTQASASDCNSAGAAISAFYSTLRANFPSNILWSPGEGVSSYDVASAAIVGVQGYTSVPAGHYGLSSDPYAAGVGARINLHTGVVVGRRLLRGANMFVPMGSDSFITGTGNVSPTSVGNIVAAYVTLLAAFTSASLSLVVWHRPPKTAPGTGVAYSVSEVSIGTAPAGLRSRRS